LESGARELLPDCSLKLVQVVTDIPWKYFSSETEGEGEGEEGAKFFGFTRELLWNCSENAPKASRIRWN